MEPTQDLTLYTVWDVTVPTTGERARIVRFAEPDDHRYQHDYQRIAYRGPAKSREDAIRRASEGR